MAWLKWLDFEETKLKKLYGENMVIQNAVNGGEKTIDGMTVDGYVDLGHKKIVFEFLGCFYHQCPFCYSYISEYIKSKYYGPFWVWQVQAP